MSDSSSVDLISEVLHAYSAENNGTLDNQSLYKIVAQRTGVDPDSFNEKVPVGASGQLHSLPARKTRWCQQTLRRSGILERVDDQRGVWKLTGAAEGDLSEMPSGVSLVGFSTDLGLAILGSCDTVFSSVDSPIHLVISSPPYPLMKARKYGNVPEHVYVDWICEMLKPIVKNLVKGGSVMLNISNDIFLSNSPARSLYRERLVIALHDRLNLNKVDELIWENPCKPPGPIQWASKERVQLNVGWEPIYWFTNDPKSLRSNNRRVLQQHTEKHLKLMKGGGEVRARESSDGAYIIKPGAYGNVTEGRIPRNILKFPHNCADQQAYKRRARAMGLAAHGAPMPLSMAEFLIKLTTEPGEMVADIFSGSGTTAKAAERLGRRWVTSEIMAQYIIGSATRFVETKGFEQFLFA